MKKKLLIAIGAAVVAVAAIVTTVLVIGNGNKHEHTFSKEWSKDATNHWHVATCTDSDGCKDAKDALAPHTLENNACTVCGYSAIPPHTHTFGEYWVSDENTHWHEALCYESEECFTAKKDESAHTFENEECAVCKYFPVSYFEFDDNGKATVNATVKGNAYAYTVRKPFMYVVTWTDENAKVEIKTETGREQIESGYMFQLNSGDRIVFYMGAESDTSYDITIGVKEEEVIVNTLNLGTTTVQSNGMEEVRYSFTATKAGTYTITWTDVKAAIMVQTASTSEEIETGYTFTLEEGESISFVMMTRDWSAPSYDVTVTEKTAE